MSTLCFLSERKTLCRKILQNRQKKVNTIFCASSDNKKVAFITAVLVRRFFRQRRERYQSRPQKARAFLVNLAIILDNSLLFACLSTPPMQNS